MVVFIFRRVLFGKVRIQLEDFLKINQCGINVGADVVNGSRYSIPVTYIK